MAQARRTKSPKGGARRADAGRKRAKPDIFDHAIKARRGTTAKERAAAARKLAAEERRAQLARERAERAREREKAKADREKARRAEARKRELAKRQKERAAAAKVKARTKLKSGLAKAKAKARNAPAGAAKVRTVSDAIVAIGQLLGASPTITTSPVSGRFVTWGAVARFDLGGITYRELAPLLDAIAADDEIGRAIGLRSLTRMRVEYKATKRSGPKEWTLGEGIGPWEAVRERAGKSVDIAGGKYKGTTLASLELWLSDDQADDTGEL